MSVASVVSACCAMRGTISPRSFRDWSRTLRGVMASLSELGGRTEGEFLTVGARLREVQAGAETVSGMASSAAALVSGPGIVAAIEGLRDIEERMRAFLSRAGSEAGGNEEALRRVGRIAGEVERPLSEFEKVVRSLRVLGICTKIESARLGPEGGDFRALANNVGDLSTRIESKSGDIVERGRDLDAAIAETLSRVLAHEAALRERARAILADASASLGALIDAHDRGAETVKAVSARWCEISRSIGEVVTSMQFHDITRQQIEHVVHALAELEAKIAAVCGGWTGATARKTVVRLAGDICALQAAHLDSAERTFASAVEDLVASLRGIASSADGIAGEAGRMTGAVDRSGETALSAIEHGLKAVVSTLKESAEAGRDVAATVRSAADTIEQMAAFVGDIEGIGIQIELVALNAVVKAAQTGAQGAALGVLAESIQRMSVDSRRQATAVADALREVRSAGGALRSSAVQGGRDDSRGEDIDDMVRDLGSLLEMLQAIDRDVRQRVSGLDDAARSLSADIEGIVGAINAHRVVSSAVADAVKDVAGIERQARRAASAERCASGTDALQVLANRYTMQKERTVHFSVTGIAPAPEGAPSVDEGSAGPGRNGNGEDGKPLGTNVELF